MPELVTMYDLHDWVSGWLCPSYELRMSNTNRWCSQWFNHPEAVARLWLMYNGYRQVSATGDAIRISEWMLDHLDRHMERLTAADGPFSGCDCRSGDRHSEPSILPSLDPPERAWGPRMSLPAVDDDPQPDTTPRSSIARRSARPTARPAPRPKH